jgi:hypothetical protein
MCCDLPIITAVLLHLFCNYSLIDHKNIASIQAHMKLFSDTYAEDIYIFFYFLRTEQQVIICKENSKWWFFSSYWKSTKNGHIEDLMVMSYCLLNHLTRISEYNQLCLVIQQAQILSIPDSPKPCFSKWGAWRSI